MLLVGLAESKDFRTMPVIKYTCVFRVRLSRRANSGRRQRRRGNAGLARIFGGTSTRPYSGVLLSRAIRFGCGKRSVLQPDDDVVVCRRHRRRRRRLRNRLTRVEHSRRRNLIQARPGHTLPRPFASFSLTPL